MVADSSTHTDKIQATLMEQHKKDAVTRHLSLLQNSPNLTAAFTSVANPESSAYLTSNFNMPSMQLNDSEYATLSRLRFRMELQIPSNLLCVCKQRFPIDVYGDHMLSCCKGKERYNNHNTVVDIITIMCRHSGLRVGVEPYNTFSELDDAKKLRPDMVITGLDVTILGDVGVTFPIPTNLTLNQSRVAGRLASDYARTKHVKYDEYAQRISNTFIPFIFETRGFWHHEFKEFFAKVLNHSSLNSGIPLKALTTYWRRRISVTLQKVIARSVLSKIKRLNSPSFFDESNFDGVILDEVCNDIEFPLEEIDYVVITE